MIFKTRKLDDLCLIKGRIGYRGYKKSDLVQEGEGAITLSPSNIINNKLNFDKCTYISWKKYDESPEIMVNSGDIIFCKTASIGKLAFIEDLPEKATLNPQFVILKNIKCENRFLFYYLQSDFFKKDISSKISGVAIPTLSQKKLGSVNVPQPPLSVQKQIVEKLDAAFADIDKAISATEKNIENAEALFSSKLKETFSQSESDDPTLGSLLKITSSKRIYKSDYVQKGIPFYRTKEIKELANGRKINTELFIDKDKFSKLREKYGAPLKGDVLITAIGTIGEVYVVESSDEFYFKDGNVLWLKGLTDIDPYFLKFSLVSFVNDLNKMSHGAAYSALPIQKLKSFKIKLPPLREQSQIVTRLDNLKRKTVRLNSIYLKKMAELHALKSSILNQAFSGELTKDAA